ncbi:hypothetical protein Droror1_Dr00017507 [Drosera rotundifolia]
MVEKLRDMTTAAKETPEMAFKFGRWDRTCGYELVQDSGSLCFLFTSTDFTPMHEVMTELDLNIRDEDLDIASCWNNLDLNGVSYG